MLGDICRIHFHIRSNAGIMAGNRARIALCEIENLIIVVYSIYFVRDGSAQTLPQSSYFA